MIRLAVPPIAESDVQAVAEVLRSGMLVQGKQVAAFERAVGEYVGAPQVVATTSGTAALHLALLALGVDQGDAVFVPAFTFPATANVVEQVGARPVLVDVDPGTYCMTPEALEKALQEWDGTEQPRAVIPVHQFGAPCDAVGICMIADRTGLWVVEDAACALGTRVGTSHAGTIGRVGCFSWHPRKAITTGEGGAVVTADDGLAGRLRTLRNHGIERQSDGSVDFVVPGLNYRMTDIQAALGRGQLSRFDAILAVRKRLAEEYLRRLAGVPGLDLPAPVPGHAWQTFMVVFPAWTDRREIIGKLRERGVEANLGAQALHLLRFYREAYGYGRDDFPVSAKLCERGLALPLHGEMTERHVKTVCDALQEVLVP